MENYSSTGLLLRPALLIWPKGLSVPGWANGRVGADETGRRSVSGGIMGTPSSRPRSGCCGLSSALQSTAVQAGKAAAGHCRERERGEEESGDSNLAHRRTCSVVVDQPTATLCLHSCRLARSAKLCNVVAQSELVIRRPVSHALAPLSAHIHWRGEGLLEMYGEGIDTCLV